MNSCGKTILEKIIKIYTLQTPIQKLFCSKILNLDVADVIVA